MLSSFPLLILLRDTGKYLCAQKIKEKTAFISPNGLYQFITMLFGLIGAPATFQHMMDSILRGLGSFTGVYLDDIVIYSEDWESHLKEVLCRLSEANLTVKMKKCVFTARDCVYLGYKIGCGGVKPEENKI